MDIEVISKIPLSSVQQSDFWAWHHESSGVFSVRSCYRMLITTKKAREDWLDRRPSSSSNRAEKAWVTLWKTKVPSKVRVFAWRLANRPMPLGSKLHRRHMATTATCELCGVENDTWRHSLLDCTMSRCVWALVDESLTEHMCLSTCPDAKEWLFHMLENGTTRKLHKTSHHFMGNLECMSESYTRGCLPESGGYPWIPTEIFGGLGHSHQHDTEARYTGAANSETSQMDTANRRYDQNQC